MTDYRVIDMLRPSDSEAAETTIQAKTPEQAAQLTFGETLVRGSARIENRIRAKVYWTDPTGTLNLVKLYRGP